MRGVIVVLSLRSGIAQSVSPGHPQAVESTFGGTPGPTTRLRRPTTLWSFPRVKSSTSSRDGPAEPRPRARCDPGPTPPARPPRGLRLCRGRVATRLSARREASPPPRFEPRLGCRLDPTSVAVAHDHAVTVLDHLLRHDHDPIERVQEGIPEAASRLTPAIDAGLHSLGPRPIDLNIGIGVTNGGVEVSSTKRLDGSAHNLHVLVRNTRSPSPFHPLWVTITGRHDLCCDIAFSVVQSVERTSLLISLPTIRKGADITLRTGHWLS